MSDERWINITGEAAVSAGMGYAYNETKGQRVESRSWCETHHCCAVDGNCDMALFANADPNDCRVVDATLILPPKAES